MVIKGSFTDSLLEQTHYLQEELIGLIALARRQPERPSVEVYTLADLKDVVSRLKQLLGLLQRLPQRDNAVVIENTVQKLIPFMTGIIRALDVPRDREASVTAYSLQSVLDSLISVEKALNTLLINPKRTFAKNRFGIRPYTPSEGHPNDPKREAEQQKVAAIARDKILKLQEVVDSSFKEGKRLDDSLARLGLQDSDQARKLLNRSIISLGILSKALEQTAQAVFYELSVPWDTYTLIAKRALRQYHSVKKLISQQKTVGHSWKSPIYQMGLKDGLNTGI